MSNLIIDQDGESDGYKVTLPCRPEEFTNFVSSLLSRGLTIEKKYNDLFKIDSQSIQQLHLLILQRVGQNNGQMVSYHAKLYFNDKSSISFNTPSDLFSHNEIKKVETVSLSIEMVFLIHFPGRLSPEKQSVSLVFYSGYFVNRYGFSRGFNDSEIALQISHTEKTWANDILNLVSGFLKNHSCTPDKATLLWNAISGKIGIISGLLCFGIGLAGIKFGFGFLIEGLRLSADASLTSEHEMLAFLVSQTTSKIFVDFAVAAIFYIAILIIASVGIASYIRQYAKITISSKLLFTEEDSRISDLARRKDDMKVFRLSLEVLKGIIIGIIANVVFSTIWK